MCNVPDLKHNPKVDGLLHLYKRPHAPASVLF